MVEHFSRIDGIDENILKILLNNSKEKIRNIAKKLGIPISTVYSRIKKLEEEGIIKRYTIEIDYKKLGYNVKAIILIKYDPNSNISQKDVLEDILKFEFAERGYIITGEWDILVVCKFRNIEEMSNFILRKLRNTNGVKETYTMVILEES